jgi:hypothetical protein
MLFSRLLFIKLLNGVIGMVQRMDHLMRAQQDGDGENDENDNGDTGDDSSTPIDMSDEAKAERRAAAQLERLRQLGEFQQSMISHALLFPNVQRLVYSTCSIHNEENELVVAAILRARPDWQVVPAMPSWPRRGVAVDGLPQSLGNTSTTCIITPSSI